MGVSVECDRTDCIFYKSYPLGAECCNTYIHLSKDGVCSEYRMEWEKKNNEDEKISLLSPVVTFIIILIVTFILKWYNIIPTNLTNITAVVM